MMDFIGIFMLIITYVLIGFGFACGLALFRYVAKMWRRRKKKQGCGIFFVCWDCFVVYLLVFCMFFSVVDFLQE